MSFAIVCVVCSLLSGQLLPLQNEIWLTLVLLKKNPVPCSQYSLKYISGKHILPDSKAVPQEFLYDGLNREMVNN